MTSTVAIIIAAYNSENTIARAVASALAEPEAAEVIMVDDASTDETVARANTADDGSHRLKIIRQERNGGPAAARNRAIDESISPWIGVLDADDFFLPGRIKALLAFAGQAELIADNMWQAPEDHLDARRSLLDPAPTGPKSIGFSEFVLSNVTRSGHQRGELGFIKPLMRRQFLDNHAIRYQEHMRLGEDFELYARMLALGARLLLVPAQGYVSVVRANSLSGQHSETDLLHLRDCGKGWRNLSDSDKDALRRYYLSVDCRLQWRLLITAVKNRNVKDAIATFMRPFPVPFYLCKQLAVESLRRVFKRNT